jgi:hypothetical protein
LPSYAEGGGRGDEISQVIEGLKRQGKLPLLHFNLKNKKWLIIYLMAEQECLSLGKDF